MNLPARPLKETRRDRRLRLPRLTRRAFGDLALYCCGFGLLIGLVFPSFLLLLAVPGEIALRPSLRAACVAAGLLVAAVNYNLARLVVGARLRDLITGMRAARAGLRQAVAAGDWSGCDPKHCHVVVDSDDDLGEAAASHNQLLDAVAHAHCVEHAVAEITAALASQLDLDNLCRTALRELRQRTGASGAAVGVHTDTGLRMVTSGDIPTDPPIGEVAAVAMRAAHHRAGPGCSPGEPPEIAHPGNTHLGRLLAVPLQAHGRVVGVLLLTHSTSQCADHPGRSDPVAGIDPVGEPTRLLDVLAAGLGVALSNALLHQQLTRLATVDDLTGLANRRTGLQRLDEHLIQAKDCGLGVGVLMADVDHFKMVNDRHGHLVGDRLLAHIAATCRRALREQDVLIRYGGEEFLAVLPDISDAALTRTAERLRAAVADTPLPTPDGPLHATISVGAARYHSTPDRPEQARMTANTLLTRADHALYAAKSAGRNCVRRAPEPSAASS